MRRAPFIALALTLLLMLWGLAAGAETRRALVIGNAEYAVLPDLQNTIDDAEAYRDTFAGLGYQVSFYRDLDLDGFAAAVDSFAGSIEGGDTVVVVYTGHGWSDGRENFLIPTDAPASGSETKLRGASYPLRDGQNGLLDILDAAGAGLTVAIIDACRNNPFAPKAGTKSVGFSRGLAPVSAPTGSFVIFSAGEGQEALDRLPSDTPDQKLSVFTRNLAPLLQESVYLEDAVAEAQLETATMALTLDGHLQHPAYYDQTLGKTCLSAKCRDFEQVAFQEPTTSKTDAAPTPPKPDIEGNPLILACDAAVMNVGNPDNPNRLPGVAIDMIDVASATAACTAALAQFPDHLRSKYHLARIKTAAGAFEQSLPMLQELAGKEYPAGIFALGDAYENGEGIGQNGGLALNYYDRACKAAHETACASYARMLFYGTGGAADKPLAIKLLRDSCARGSGFGCEFAALALEEDPAHKDEVVPLLQKGCEQKDDYACAALALRQWQGEDYSAALTNYAQACDHGIGWACRNLGLMQRDGQGAPADRVAAAARLEKACALDNADACSDRGWLSVDQGDEAKALGFFKTGCDLKGGGSCTNVGFQIEQGKGATTDRQEALHYYELGCSYGDGTGCNNIANLTYSTEPGPQGLRKSMEYHRKACDLDIALGCRSVGMLLFDGTVDAADQTAGLDLLEKSCTLKSGQGCATLGNYLEKLGDSSPAVSERIQAAYLQGCALDWGGACADIGQGYLYGRFGLAKDAAKAREYLELGCGKSEYAYACDKLALSIKDPQDGELFVDAALKACDGGYGDHCVELALWSYGPPKPRPAVDLLVQGLKLKSGMPKQVIASLDKSQIALLQEALGQLGLYKGKADGKRGPATMAALEAVYQP
ncbi:MAG: caspase family protein [Cypionkella sp.]